MSLQVNPWKISILIPFLVLADDHLFTEMPFASLPPSTSLNKTFPSFLSLPPKCLTMHININYSKRWPAGSLVQAYP